MASNNNKSTGPDGYRTGDDDEIRHQRQPISPGPAMTLEELRVAQAELHSSKGKVFVRVSEGAVAFSTDRTVAQTQVAASIRDEILKESNEYNENANYRKRS